MNEPTKKPELNYASYLHIEELLGIQIPQSDPPEHDETLFIVIHQVYELWFKQVLHELDLAGPRFRDADLWGVAHVLKRVRMILKTLVSQIDILETMTPSSFVSFRDRLDTSSGFQSMQFRCIEFRLGIKRDQVLKFLPEGLHGRDEALARYRAPSILDDFHVFLSTQGLDVPSAILDAPTDRRYEGDDAMQDILLQAHESRPELDMLFETMLDIDEGLQEWRYRHVQLVRRTIGNKHGTGGSPGVPYLERSLFEPAFPDLWAIRHRF
ncbi:MAG: tryptophan 2,3-dioxygenase [Phycisphaerae bacterium]|nr:tryptophan 2,3-dioxygenase [Phycisphaerae bacterium]|tara:strand:- start:1401 stop:2204 length:804 start_codon:yes stop_codon:yes gene_type:complete